MVTMARDTIAAPVLGEATLQDLREGLSGSLVLPGDEAYDSARRLWNGMIDRRPALIVQCATASDVAAGIQFARSHSLLLAVRGGGH
ncbi:MAG: FAD-linked oxidase, partial [Chloroflexia bacterium]|nr:FAD-linked oxidase [Chloroflexia bacterium]